MALGLPASLPRAASIVAALLVAGWLGVALVNNSGSQQLTILSTRVRADQRLQLGATRCNPPIADIIQSAVEREHPPLLHHPQLQWIASLVQGQQARAAGRGVHLLVFGLGYDSDVWQAVNCRGRTVFLENHQGWIDKVAGEHQELEVYHVDYQGKLRDPDAFFTSPWLMDVPPVVSKLCFDVILVDAPQGYKEHHPGRMESSYFAVQTAKRCIAAGQVEDVVILLHDVERPVEQQIMKQIFSPTDNSIERLGIIKGRRGHLAGFRVVGR